MLGLSNRFIPLRRVADFEFGELYDFAVDREDSALQGMGEKGVDWFRVTVRLDGRRNVFVEGLIDCCRRYAYFFRMDLHSFSLSHEFDCVK